MSFMGKVFSYLGFEGSEKETKTREKKEKTVKASYNFKKKNRFEKKDSIDGVKVLYPETLEDALKVCDYMKNDEAVIISIEHCQKSEIEKLVAYITGASEMVGGKIRTLEKDKYYIFLPEGVEIEEA